MDATFLHEDNAAVIFSPLKFRNLEVKNRLFRSNLSGMFDEYNGHGGHARLNWEEKFAKGGVGCIISSYTPVAVRGRILIRYAMIDNDDKVPFWREIGKRVHDYDCRFLMQLSHSGRQQDMGGVENMFKKALSSTNQTDFFHGILAQAMTVAEIHEVVEQFAQGARRARQAGLDGVELHGANGYLITQFLSSGINDRKDDYGGSVENRARFALEIVRAIRREVGRDFHLQMKINGVDHNDWLYPWKKKGNTLEDTLTICKMLLDDGKGVDSFHISSGSTFPHPRNPPGDISIVNLVRWYAGLFPSGVRTRFNYAIFSNPIGGPLFRWLWRFRRGKIIEGINATYAKYLRDEIIKIDPSVKFLCTGGFQHADVIADVIRNGSCDGVSMARPLIANNDLPHILRAANGPIRQKECTYCNKCLLNDLANPLGCYEVQRYDGDTFDEKWESLIKEVMSVFEPPLYQ
ncbi:MAG TPA: NADH:flavin oxidoreductase [Acetobacteraceae bacterium]|nr:NADH:flavin oxidoreductase [Acetobacteraceae bacterium]